MSNALPSDVLTFQHGPTWPNRIALAPLTNKQSHSDGALSSDEIEWLVARARGGFGLVLTAAAFVSPAGQVWDGQLGVCSPEHDPGLKQLAHAIRSHGAASAVQLHHGGRRAERQITGRQVQCPWDDPRHDAVAMTAAEITQVIGDFVAAAVRAQDAGFDGVEVHGAHGYLIGQFLDSSRNHRDDQYGGSFENRLRILLEVLAGIRAATAGTFQLGLRLSPEGFGIPLADAQGYAREVLASDLLDYVELSLWDVFSRPRGGDEGLLIDHFVDLPRGAARLGVAGKVLTTADVSWCLDRGADFVSVGRGAILQHDFAARALADADFVSRPAPVSAAVLTSEKVGPAFIDYLTTDFQGIVG